MHRCFAVPCVAQQDRPPHKLARSAARPRAQTYSSDYPCLASATRRRTGEKKAETNFKIKTPKPVGGRKAPNYTKNKRGHCAHTKPLFVFPFPCAPPRYFANKRRFRRALFELRSGARFVCPARASCAAPLVGEISREPRRGGAPGAPSLGYFSWQDKKGNLLPGNPRRFSMGIATLNPSYVCSCFRWLAKPSNSGFKRHCMNASRSDSANTPYFRGNQEVHSCCVLANPSHLRSSHREHCRLQLPHYSRATLRGYSALCWHHSDDYKNAQRSWGLPFPPSSTDLQNMNT